jgi:hypothetical protein
MDGQVNSESLFSTIGTSEIQAAVADILVSTQQAIAELFEGFIEGEVTPANTHAVEVSLQKELRKAGRELLQWLISSLETSDVERMPCSIKIRGKTFRRLADKTPNHDVVTLFGRVKFERARYRRGRAGKTVSPLQINLGIMRGFTPAAADMTGKQFAATGSSQGRTIAALIDRIDVGIGDSKLRNLAACLADSLEPYREECQIDQLNKWLAKAWETRKTPVLSVSRDGVSLGIAPGGYFEMASVATITVLAEGKRLGTVYLGRAPETNQQTLTNNLTSLLRKVLSACGDKLPNVVYVTDAGKIETAYWKNVLRKFFVDGRRIKILRVVDYYHASERLTKIADALKFGKNKQKRFAWLAHVRGLLLKPGGHGRMLRSVAKMKKLYGYKVAAKSTASEAEAYLRRYRRFMDYAAMRKQKCPIGSGVVESGCKQVVSERLKLAGMRWHREGAQHVLTLRCILLSKIWETTYKKMLDSLPTVSDPIITLAP